MKRGRPKFHHVEADVPAMDPSDPRIGQVTPPDFQDFTPIDKAPEKDVAMGDKTPAYVEWFFDNHSQEEAFAKYGHRKFQNNPTQ
jgi:hypothetical protein